MKIGIYQSNIVWENKKENIERFKQRLQHNQECMNVVFLPEMSFTGFSMNTEITGEYNDETSLTVINLCKKHHTAIGFGWVKGTNNSENHYTVLNKHGECISDYVKIHPFSFSGEDKHFISGRDLSYFDIEGVRFCTVICYDLRFPELFRIASMESDVIVVPANWPAKRDNHWRTLLKARAIENQVYIIGINCVGDIGDMDYCGNSCVIAPDGDVLVAMKGMEGLVTVELKNDVEEYRSMFPSFKDRKDELYYELYRGTV